jgi:lipoate-protein ligase B
VGQTGVWVQPDVASRCLHCPPESKLAPSKIASIGVKVDARGISRHGFALNVATDMSYWKGIIACGLENQNQISLEYLLDPAPGMERVMEEVVKSFGATFDYEMVTAQAQAS